MSDKTENREPVDKLPVTGPLAKRLEQVQQRMNRACRQAQRAVSSVRLLAVSKTRSSDEIRALRAMGVGAFGENYLAEAERKLHQLSQQDIEWHFIGPMQSNKTKAIAALFDWVQSVDREKIVRRLADQRPAQRPALQVLIQVNIDRESQKSGCLPEQLDALVDSIVQRKELNLRGLMAIPAAASRDSTASFEEMAALFESLKQQHAQIDTLSLGMSSDLEPAIEAGSTMIRIGTDLFGPHTT